MARSPKMAVPRLSAEEIDELEREYFGLADAQDEAAQLRRREIVGALRQCGQHLHCDPDEPLVEVDIPPGPDGIGVRINGKEYVGLKVLPMCTWRQIESTLDLARRRRQAEQFDNGYIRELGTVSGTGPEAVFTPNARLVPDVAARIPHEAR